jgi:pantothenate kinase type III
MYAEGPLLIKAIAYDTKNWIDEAFECIQSVTQQKFAVIGYSSVNTLAEAKLIQKCSNLNTITWINAGEIAYKATYPDFSCIKGIGYDRVLGIIGALRFTSMPFITIDCGTAITVNVLNVDGVCLGGAIMPGFTTMHASLHNSTAQLPQLQPDSLKHFIGKNSIDAIHAGINTAIKGAIKEYSTQFPDYSFVLLGGDAHILFELLDDEQKRNSSIQPDCIAIGIFNIMKDLP